ncbi:hypothetical protein SDC9_11665 [bioreactor metagenome]|uniref:Uncharacterized protein n=1 Tax=bioreactor metagenome TaxID=1076179 RepID=A0A644THU2_9ZZZZ
MAKLTSLLYADHIITEDNGKKSAIGIFSQISSFEFPVITLPWGIYFSFADIEEKQKFKLDMVSLDDQSSILSFEGEFSNVKDDDRTIEVSIMLPNVTFKKPGVYVGRVFLEGKLLGEKVLLVKKIEPQK